MGEKILSVLPPLALASSAPSVAKTHGLPKIRSPKLKPYEFSSAKLVSKTALKSHIASRFPDTAALALFGKKPTIRPKNNRVPNIFFIVDFKNT